MALYDYDLFVIGGGSGGVRAARMFGRLRRQGRHCRGIPLGRHLCDPRLHPQRSCWSTHRMSMMRLRMLPVSAGPIPAAQFSWPKLIENKDKEIARTQQDLCRSAGQIEGPGDRSAGAPGRSAYHRGRWPQRHREAHPGRDRRPAGTAADSRHRAFHHLERGVPPAASAQARGGGGRRLYRARVLRHLQWSRRQDPSALSWCTAAARLRRRRP